VRIVVADEVDRFPVSAGSEGDPLALASKRQGTFWNRKTLVGSTPTLKETSAIWREWQQSDMRHYQVPCHACGHAQALVWSNVRWDKTPDGKHLPATAHYVCESCGAIWTDTDRHDAVAKGRWVASKPDVIGVAGFHITGLLSPWVALADIVREFLMSKSDPSLLQVWTNTVLGEPFEPAQETVEGSSLLRRGENYGPQSIPDAVKLLTAGVDVQGDRIEVQILGFGALEEVWAVRYEVLPGDPAQRQVWGLLDGVLTEPYRTDAGRELRVRVSCVDSGGHHQHQMLSYCGLRRSRGVLAIKGVAGPRPIWPARSSRPAVKSQFPPSDSAVLPFICSFVSPSNFKCAIRPSVGYQSPAFPLCDRSHSNIARKFEGELCHSSSGFRSSSSSSSCCSLVGAGMYGGELPILMARPFSGMLLKKAKRL
jgi:phage terminase large subunit GpA-like protein